ncbi:hypothetical protein BGW38_007974 [Lunasporangiospora selenospora]|uniref:BRCT domain-containing protein n=1 Tax=Lunasporangiospora selenospora TaxID=979761 RepID=A0A9P6FY98_9FUNG|nr:hypothetical protein BGW38_007974 [Lunasporangiospora selenospora]
MSQFGITASRPASASTSILSEISSGDSGSRSSQRIRSQQSTTTSQSRLFVNAQFVPLQICLSRSIKDFDDIAKKIRSHGGAVTQSEKNAYVCLADPGLKYGANMFSTTWVDDCIRSQRLLAFNVPEYRLKLAARSWKMPFTREDDNKLREYIQDMRHNNRKLCGNSIYMDFAHPEHTAQSWRDRAIQVLRLTAPPSSRGNSSVNQGQEVRGRAQEQQIRASNHIDTITNTPMSTIKTSSTTLIRHGLNPGPPSLRPISPVVSGITSSVQSNKEVSTDPSTTHSPLQSQPPTPLRESAQKELGSNLPLSQISDVFSLEFSDLSSDEEEDFIHKENLSQLLHRREGNAYSEPMKKLTPIPPKCHLSHSIRKSPEPIRSEQGLEQKQQLRELTPSLIMDKPPMVVGAALRLEDENATETHIINRTPTTEDSLSFDDRTREDIVQRTRYYSLPPNSLQDSPCPFNEADAMVKTRKSRKSLPNMQRDEPNPTPKTMGPIAEVLLQEISINRCTTRQSTRQRDQSKTTSNTGSSFANTTHALVSDWRNSPQSALSIPVSFSPQPCHTAPLVDIQSPLQEAMSPTSGVEKSMRALLLDEDDAFIVEEFIEKQRNHLKDPIDQKHELGEKDKEEQRAGQGELEHHKESEQASQTFDKETLDRQDQWEQEWLSLGIFSGDENSPTLDKVPQRLLRSEQKPDPSEDFSAETTVNTTARQSQIQVESNHHDTENSLVRVDKSIQSTGGDNLEVEVEENLSDNGDGEEHLLQSQPLNNNSSHVSLPKDSDDKNWPTPSMSVSIDQDNDGMYSQVELPAKLFMAPPVSSRRRLQNMRLTRWNGIDPSSSEPSEALPKPAETSNAGTTFIKDNGLIPTLMPLVEEETSLKGSSEKKIHELEEQVDNEQRDDATDTLHEDPTIVPEATIAEVQESMPETIDDAKIVFCNSQDMDSVEELIVEEPGNEPFREHAENGPRSGLVEMSNIIRPENVQALEMEVAIILAQAKEIASTGSDVEHYPCIERSHDVMAEMHNVKSDLSSQSPPGVVQETPNDLQNTSQQSTSELIAQPLEMSLPEMMSEEQLPVDVDSVDEFYSVVRGSSAQAEEDYNRTYDQLLVYLKDLYKVEIREMMLMELVPPLKAIDILDACNGDMATARLFLGRGMTKDIESRFWTGFEDAKVFSSDNDDVTSLLSRHTFVDIVQRTQYLTKTRQDAKRFKVADEAMHAINELRKRCTRTRSRTRSTSPTSKRRRT